LQAVVSLHAIVSLQATVSRGEAAVKFLNKKMLRRGKLGKKKNIWWGRRPN